MKLMGVSDVINALNLLRILLFFLTPTFVLLISVYAIRMIHKRLKNRGVKSKKLISDKKLDKALKNEPYTPKDKSKYMSLNLEFDERGFVKK